MRSTDGTGISSVDWPDRGEHVRIGEIGLAVRLDPPEQLVEHLDRSAVGCARWLIAVVDILELHRQRQPNPGRGVREGGVQRPAMVEADLSLAQGEGDPDDGSSIRGELLLDGGEVGVVEESGMFGCRASGGCRRSRRAVRSSSCLHPLVWSMCCPNVKPPTTTGYENTR